MLVAGFVGYLSDFCCVIMCTACDWLLVCWYCGLLATMLNCWLFLAMALVFVGFGFLLGLLLIDGGCWW